MNKSKFRKNLGKTVRLRPIALRRGVALEDADWKITEVEDDKVKIYQNEQDLTASLGLDLIYSYTTDPNRKGPHSPYGFLQLLVQLYLMESEVQIEPLPSPRTPSVGPNPKLFQPLRVCDGKQERLFSWRGRDPVHLITEDRPKQLSGFSVTLCDALRKETELEPKFELPSNIRGEVVYEISLDFRTKWPLLGGGGLGTQYLVLVPKD